MSLKSISSKNKLPLLSESLTSYLALISKDYSHQLKHKKLIVFGRDVLRDLSKNSIHIHRVGIAQSVHTPISNEIRDVMNEIESDAYYSASIKQIKQLTTETHKHNPKEVFGEVNMPNIITLNDQYLENFSPNNTLLFSQNFNKGILASLIRTSFGLGWKNILIPNNINLFDSISLRCSKSSLFFNTIYTYDPKDLMQLYSSGLVFNIDKLNISQINQILDEIKQSSEKGNNNPKIACFICNSCSDGNNVDETVLAPLVAGSLILSKLRQHPSL